MRFKISNWQDKYIALNGENERKVEEWLSLKGGALLISGDRGTGKTSMLRNIEKNNSSALKFIWLNAIRLGANSDVPRAQ
ncbi:MAG: hypothetical protein Fur003_0550 [Candidatus Dojkabacteria bacterium]